MHKIEQCLGNPLVGVQFTTVLI